jgi:hypothetical protein
MSDQQPINKPNPLANYFRQPKLYIKLPSRGKFYPEGSLDVSEIDEYAVYAMTAKDELMFKTPDALMNGQATVEVIKSCIPSIKNPWAMPSIDIDTALIAIRIATYGENMEFTSTCPVCSHYNDLVFQLMNYLDVTSEFDYNDLIVLGPLQVYIRPYSYKEISKHAIRTLEQQKLISIVNDDTLSDEEKIDLFGESFVKLTELTVSVIAGCVYKIETPEGVVEDAAMIKEFVENSDKATFNAINERISKMKEEISLKSQHITCESCSHEYDIEITMDQANFFAVGS